jgi:hypothetical protein
MGPSDFDQVCPRVVQEIAGAARPDSAVAKRCERRHQGIQRGDEMITTIFILLLGAAIGIGGLVAFLHFFAD